MKKILNTTLALALAFGATALVATDADARAKGVGITGSSHDFTDNAKSDLYEPDSMQELRIAGDETGWNYRGEICRVCHVPHDHNRENFRGYSEDGLLWNHAVSAKVYDVYTSNSLAATPGQPTGKSKLCLGCHDGTVGLNAYDRNVAGDRTDAGDNTLTIVNYNAGYRVGTTAGADAGLMATHPVSVAYVGNAKIGIDGGLHDPATAVFPDSGLPVANYLDEGRVECSSCHDVHDSAASIVGTRLNRASQSAGHANGAGIPSGLCLSCHNK